MAEFNKSKPQGRLIARRAEVRPEVWRADVREEIPAAGGPAVIFVLLRKYWLLAIALLFAGCLAGVASVVYTSPIYKVRVLLEVQGISEALLKNSFEQASTYDSTSVNIQTQINLLKQGPFLRRVKERLEAETIPSPPPQSDFFSRLRVQLRPDAHDPIEVMKEGLAYAYGSFDARPVNGTRLIELSCDSTSPQMASQFINAMAVEFIDETMRSRSQSLQKTGQWLTSQIDDQKTKLQEAEAHLQSFVRGSGNLFVSDDATLDDSKLKQLRGELSSIQADRIGKQATFEMVTKSRPENLTEVFDDTDLRNLQRQISDLRREKAALEGKLTPEHPKVQKVDSQLTAVQQSLDVAIRGLMTRSKNEYEAARRREALLSAEYATQLGRVSSVAGKSAEYNSLKREVDTLRQLYQGLLVQSNQSGISSSVPFNPVRLVDPSLPPPVPYRPQPMQSISFSMISGLALAAGIAFLREHLDRSLKYPTATTRLLNVPQLGVIPSAMAGEGVIRRFFQQPPTSQRVRLRLGSGVGTSISSDSSSGSVVTQWNDGPSFLAESFRSTLTSLIHGCARDVKTILITSPGPAEGKTTVTANLALALAETGRQVLVIDADFRRPRQHRVFKVSNDKALGEFILGEQPLDLEAMITPSEVAGISLLLNKPIMGKVASVLHSERLRKLIESAQNQFDIILIDSSPMLNLADARLLGSMADGIVLVLRSGSTGRDRALEACQLLQADGLNLLGTVLNDWNPGKAHMKRHYYYEYSEKDES